METRYVTLPAFPRLAAFCFSPSPGFHFPVGWCSPVQRMAEAASAGGHRAGLAAAHQAWGGTGSSESIPTFTWISAPRVCVLGLQQEGTHASVRLSIAPVCVFACCGVRGGDAGAGSRVALPGAGGGPEAGGQTWLRSLPGARGCRVGASAPGESGELPSGQQPPCLLPCPWHPSFVQEVGVLSPAALLCKCSHGCLD